MSSRPGIAALDDLSDDDLVPLAQGGDPSAEQALIQRYRRFASSKARGYRIPGGDADDIDQEALIGLYRAVRDYRGGRGATFRTFAELCITRQILTAVRTARRRKHQPLNQYVSISPPRGQERREWLLEQFLGDHPAHDPADDVIADDDTQALNRLVATLLSSLEVEVLRLFVQGRTYQEIGAQLGRHAKSVDNALQRVKRKLGNDAAWSLTSVG
ncbi:MAG: RNA polymerase sporulation sigma factor SigH [Acidimicrobiales bacterium]